MYTNIKSCAQFIGFVVALVATFFVYSDIASANSLTANGLNEYIDPSQNPKYSQVYNEIIFSGDGITMEELDEINSLVNLKDNATEEPSAIVSEEIIPISKLKAGSKVKSISYSSKSDDTKISELNYYRGKDENLENKKAKRQELRDKKDKALDSSFAKLDTEILSQEQLIQKNKANWERKAKSKKAQVDKLKTKTQTAISSTNKEIMDILYPSKENIDKLNAEILEERRMSKEFLEQNANRQKSMREKLKAWVTIPEALAWGDSSNSVNNLVIYNRSNWNYIWDVDYANAVNGQTFKLWGRANDAPKQFRFVDARAEIRFVGKPGVEKCVDVDLANGRYDNGDRVHLWDCHGGNNQKFIVQSDGTIRPKLAQHMCLDASAGISFGSRIHLWQCHGGQNQKFNAGEYDFDGQRFYLRIQSLPTPNAQNISGHTFVSVWRTQRGITNTFSFWPNRDFNDSNNNGRKNNIGTGNYINIDHEDDWNNSYLGNAKGFRYKDIMISKQMYDEIKYLRGYQVNNSYVRNPYDWCVHNCVRYSTDLWNRYTGDSLRSYSYLTACHSPGIVYNSL